MWKIRKHRQQLVKIISKIAFLFSLANMTDSVGQFVQPSAVRTEHQWEDEWARNLIGSE